MRVVLDTNILVSACWKADGLEAQVVNLAIAGGVTACITAEIQAEYEDVLARRKLASVGGRAAEILAGLAKSALTIEHTQPVAASVDEDDNRFLECAESACAEYLITGNLRHYPATWKSTQIVNARTFLTAPGLTETVSEPLQ